MLTVRLPLAVKFISIAITPIVGLSLSVWVLIVQFLTASDDTPELGDPLDPGVTAVVGVFVVGYKD